ncbi:anti-sigma factor family protein [Pseudonocardia sp. Cha107L01]|jgi:anti-sigma factor RsiW|uniref:anti-sigma factor family protein n=1 Tax=Pseudonocardia sp. Cha107L01 TaxID=3457576 RepID=UPI00403E7191
MTELRGQPSAGPAWGGHIALDAIVAYVDEELSSGARRRALEHLSRCPECAAEVIAQTQARLALRGSAAPSLPSSLLSSLRAIPQETELPAPPAGLGVGPSGELVSILREPAVPSARRRPDRRARLGAGAVVTGLAIGGLMVAGNGAAPPAATTATFGGTSSIGGVSSLDSAVPVTGLGPVKQTNAEQVPVWDARTRYGGGTLVRAVPTPAPSSAPIPAPAVVRHAHG